MKRHLSRLILLMLFVSAYAELIERTPDTGFNADGHTALSSRRRHSCSCYVSPSRVSI